MIKRCASGSERRKKGLGCPFSDCFSDSAVNIIATVLKWFAGCADAAFFGKVIAFIVGVTDLTSTLRASSATSFFLLDPKALQSNQTKPLVRDPYIFLPSSSTTLQLSHAPQHSDSPCKVCREGYNWNQLILHASIYLRKQSLEILICKMIMMQAESYMLNTLLCKSLNCRFRIGPYLFFSLLPHQSTSIPFFSIC